MRLYEFEAKSLLRGNDLPVPWGVFTTSPRAAARFVEAHGEAVVKAQTIAGKRASAGGILFADMPIRAELAAEMLLDSTLYGEEVIGVLVEEKVDVRREFYISFYYDPQLRSLMLAFSLFGGTGVEEQVRARPGRLHKLPLPICQDVRWRLRDLLVDVLDEDPTPLVELLARLYEFFLRHEFSYLEINPLAETDRQDYVILDVVSSLDAAALGRHPEIAIAPRASAKASLPGGEFKSAMLNIEDARGTRRDFVHLGGDIALLAIGGSISLILVDYLYRLGGRPFNYAELRGSVTAKRIAHVLREILSKPQIKGLLIVGASTDTLRIDAVAEGIHVALKEIKPAYPIVLRVPGLGKDVAKEILSGLRRTNMQVLEKATIMESVRAIMEKAYGNPA